MKYIILSRWSERSRRSRIRFGIALFLGLVLTGLGLGSVLSASDSGRFSHNNGLPVQAHADKQYISVDIDAKAPVAGENYFVNYRLQREQSRQDAKVMLAPLLNSDVRKNREEAQQKWLELTQKIEKEGRIENLLKIKGFSDAVADVSPQGLNIIIYASTLSPDEVRLIQNIVIQLTNVRIDKISISYRD